MNPGHKTPAKGGGCGLDCAGSHPAPRTGINRPWYGGGGAPSKKSRTVGPSDTVVLPGGIDIKRFEQLFRQQYEKQYGDALFTPAMQPGHDLWIAHAVCFEMKECREYGNYLARLNLESFLASGGIEMTAGELAGLAPSAQQLLIRRNLAKAACEGNSFTPDTKVLMADGNWKPIEEVKIGDKVVATDPESGKTRAEPVVDTIVGQGEKNLVQITVDTTGLRPFWPADAELKKPASPLRPKSGVVIATDAHPFWVAGSLNKWVKAADLKPGMWLRTSAGTYVQVTATKQWTAHHQRVHNLSVAELHTYYVLASKTSLLVHNIGSCDPPPLKSLHPEGSLDKSSLNYWHKQDTENIVFSLRPGAHEALIVKPDGTVMNGNTRINVLRSRGYDVNSLPRESYGGEKPMTDDDFWNMDQ